MNVATEKRRCRFGRCRGKHVLEDGAEIIANGSGWALLVRPVGRFAEDADRREVLPDERDAWNFDNVIVTAHTDRFRCSRCGTTWCWRAWPGHGWYLDRETRRERRSTYRFWTFPLWMYRPGATIE